MNPQSATHRSHFGSSDPGCPFSAAASPGEMSPHDNTTTVRAEEAHLDGEDVGASFLDWGLLPPAAPDAGGDALLSHTDPGTTTPPLRPPSMWLFTTLPAKGTPSSPPFKVQDEQRQARAARMRDVPVSVIPPFPDIWAPGGALNEPPVLLGHGGFGPLDAPWGPAPRQEIAPWAALGEGVGGLPPPPAIDFTALLDAHGSPAFIGANGRFHGTSPERPR